MTTKSISKYDTDSKQSWLKRFAWAVPLFFLIKGLLWLIVPGLLAYYGLK